LLYFLNYVNIITATNNISVLVCLHSIQKMKSSYFFFYCLCVGLGCLRSETNMTHDVWKGSLKQNF